MKNFEQAGIKIYQFLESDRKGLLMTGTNADNKDIIIPLVLNQFYNGKQILIRGYQLMSIYTLWSNALKFGLTKLQNTPQAGKIVNFGKNHCTLDSFSSLTQSKTRKRKYDIAIVLLGTSVEEDKKVIKELLDNRTIGKLFLVLDYGADANHYAEALAEYYTDHVVYDAEE